MSEAKPRRRRVRTEPAAGSDPSPQSGRAELAAENTPAAWGDQSRSGVPQPEGPNDDQLLRDKPPHWG